MSRAFLRHPTTSNFLRRSRTVSTKTSSTDPVEQNLRRDLAIAHRLIAHHGMDELHWNHISARDQSWGKGKYLVTPGDKHFACIEPADLVLMGSTTGKQLENVTADVIHGAVYQGRPDILAIVHVHTDAGMYVSCLPGDDPLTFYSQDGTYIRSLFLQRKDIYISWIYRDPVLPIACFYFFDYDYFHNNVNVRLFLSYCLSFCLSNFRWRIVW